MEYEIQKGLKQELRRLVQMEYEMLRPLSYVHNSEMPRVAVLLVGLETLSIVAAGSATTSGDTAPAEYNITYVNIRMRKPADD